MRNEAIEKLVKRAQKGDEAATEELYRLHSRRIYSLCIRMVANQAEAEDLTQEIFLHAFRKINTFRGEAAFSTWLYRLGVNIVLMQLRKKSHPEVSLDELTWPNGEATKRAEPADKTDHARNLVDRLALRVALDQLPVGFKRVIVMHDMEGYNHREIAELTGRSVGNSKSQLHKARRRLRELLETEGPRMADAQAVAHEQVA